MTQETQNGFEENMTTEQLNEFNRKINNELERRASTPEARKAANKRIRGMTEAELMKEYPELGRTEHVEIKRR